MPIDGFTLNTERLQKQLERFKKEALRELDQEMHNSTERVFDHSQILVPVDTGALKATGTLYRNGDRDYSVEYGDPAATNGVGVDYAAAVHEILRARHEPPTQAKFVEQPLIEESHSLPEHLAGAIDKAKAKVFK